MEPTGEEIAANELSTSAEIKKGDCDIPVKPEGCNILGYPGNECPKNSNVVYTDASESESLNKFKMPSGRYGFPRNSPYSTSNAAVKVEELTVKNFKIPDLNIVSSSSNKEGMPFGQGQWQHLYQLGSGPRRNPHADYTLRDKDPMPFGLIDRKPWLSIQDNRDQHEVTANLMDNKSKFVSSSGFSHFLVKQSVKGKAVLSKGPENSPECPLVVTGKKEEARVVQSNPASGSSLKSTAKIEEHSRNSIDSSLDGINLREWLKPAHREINKGERLRLFRQIVQIVDFAHSQGVVLQDLLPSCFIILPSNRVKYSGSSIPKEKLSIMNQDMNRKRPLEQETRAHFKLGVKQQKRESESKISGLRHFDYANSNARNSSSYQNKYIQTQQESEIFSVQLEKNWYACPVEPNAQSLLSSNIYALGILLFELFCCFESFEVHSAAMLDLQQRILPPKFLSEYPKEAGFCLWLLHPEPSSRPTTREILRSELMCGSEELNSGVDLSSSAAEADDEESKLLLYFLTSLKEQKQKHESKLLENLGCLEEDIKEIERRHTLGIPSDRVKKALPDSREWEPHPSAHINTGVYPKALSVSNMSKLEDAYFHKRSQINSAKTIAMERPDKDLLRNRFPIENAGPKAEMKPIDCLGEFYEGISKFTRYNKFEVRGTLRNVDLLNSTNVICSLSFDRDEEYIAAAGVSKKIKVFEFASLLKNSADIHYPAVEMSNKSKLSCVCWNKYIKNYLASTDYDGVVQMWDASTGQGFSQYAEHQKRAWSVDFSQVDPMKFVSGSDDCSVKLWSINEKDSVSTIRSPANVCCVQFSDHSSHILAFGSADYKIYGYDLRHTRIPWCTLAGHGKTVSYVKFLDSETLVSASTDNTLKLWDLSKTSLEGLSSNACSSTFTGHTNEKNFVGLSVHDGYIACGSETNEVYAYYRSLPMPITSHRFGCVDPVTGQEMNDSNGQFVSSVCWRGKSNMVVAANSTGSIKLLQMV